LLPEVTYKVTLVTLRCLICHLEVSVWYLKVKNHLVDLGYFHKVPTQADY